MFQQLSQPPTTVIDTNAEIIFIVKIFGVCSSPKKFQLMKFAIMSGDLLITLLLLVNNINVFVFAIPTVQSERIITNYDDVINGVELNYLYNESLSTEGISSAPGCPKSDQGIPWLYFGSAKKCYLVGHRGPCARNEKLFIQSESQFGVCSCACFDTTDKFNTSKTQFCASGDSTLVFVAENSEDHKCYKLLEEQGPCLNGEWLVKQSSGTIKCEKRQCPEGLPGRLEEGKIDCGFLIYPANAPAFISSKECNDKGWKYSTLLKTCVKPIKIKL